MCNNAEVGISFTPNITPDHYFGNPNPSDPYIVSIVFQTLTTALITTAFPHGLQNGIQIMIGDTNSAPLVDGIYSVTVLNPLQFTIPVDTPGIVTPGTQGSWSLLPDVAVSSNDVKPNRLFYSKLSQPDAVPLLNY